MELSSLKLEGYSIVYNFFSITIAYMLAAALFFILAQSQVAPKYRISLLVSTLLVAITAYHY